ncbi:MAG: hypothetical protein ACJAW3_001256 [Lentimonas sp.]|jgi:hypothetical protein
MLEKFFDRTSAISLILVFFTCALIYNIGYFNSLGGSLRYFFYVPVSFFDIISSGLWVSVMLSILLFIFKPILINPAFLGSFPNAAILLTIAVAVLLSNFLYFSIFSDSQNRMLALTFEVLFYLFATVCFIAILYYFLDGSATIAPLLVFVTSLIILSFLIGSIDAKIATTSNRSGSKSQILLKNDRVINAKVIRSVDKGIFILTGKALTVDFISWDEVKGVKFKIEGF